MSMKDFIEAILLKTEDSAILWHAKNKPEYKEKELAIFCSGIRTGVYSLIATLQARGLLPKDDYIPPKNMN